MKFGEAWLCSNGPGLDDDQLALRQQESSVTPMVEPLTEHRHELGEMPYWDAARQRLVYVDINAGTINELDVSNGERRVIDLQPPLGFAMPVEGSDLWLCGQGNDLIVVDASGTEHARHPVEPGLEGNRLNEGKADPRGRLWFGSLSKTRALGEAALYRFDQRGLTRIRSITIGNGTDWDIERRRMYHVDSLTQQVDVFDYDVDSGEVDNVRRWVSIEAADGLPDGLTVDRDGCVWLALFGGGVVRRYDPDGVLMRTIALPTPFATCPAFGGADLSTLYITTSRHRIPLDEQAAHPLAGAVFAIDAGAVGRPVNMVARDVAAAVGS
jgi:sugar lactone lactonase YvrE